MIAIRCTEAVFNPHSLSSQTSFFFMELPIKCFIDSKNCPCMPTSCRKPLHCITVPKQYSPMEPKRPLQEKKNTLQFFGEIRHTSMRQFHEHPVRHPFLFIWEPRYSGASSCGGSKLNSKAYKPPRPFNPHSLHQSITLRCNQSKIECDLTNGPLSKLLEILDT